MALSNLEPWLSPNLRVNPHRRSILPVMPNLKQGEVAPYRRSTLEIVVSFSSHLARPKGTLLPSPTSNVGRKLHTLCVPGFGLLQTGAKNVGSQTLAGTGTSGPGFSQIYVSIPLIDVQCWRAIPFSATHRGHRLYFSIFDRSLAHLPPLSSNQNLTYSARFSQ